MTIDAVTRATEVDGGSIRQDARCIRCGYDLRGHDVGGRCPECGLKAHWSLRAPVLLSQYPAGWVSAMARGVKLLAIAYLLLFVMLILSVGGALQQHDEILYGALLLAGGLQVAGAWTLSTSSRHWSEPRSPLNRLLLRVAPPLLPLGAIGAIGLMFDFRQAVAGATALAMALSLLAPLAAFLRIRTVARMIADVDLMEHSAVVGGGFLASLVAGAALYLFIGFGGAGTSVWPTVALFGVIIALLLFLLWGAFLMFCCILDFSQAARIARADWRDDEAAVTTPSSDARGTTSS